MVVVVGEGGRSAVGDEILHGSLSLSLYNSLRYSPTRQLTTNVSRSDDRYRSIQA